MKPRYLEKKDASYKVYLYIFYVCGFIMIASLVFGVYVTTIEWIENGTYVMGEAITIQLFLLKILQEFQLGYFSLQ